MGCCDRCEDVSAFTYELCGDGDGVEFLVETARLHAGGSRESTVMLSLLGC